MKKALCLTVALSLFANVAFADCDYSKIVKNQDGTYTYSKELHICVGQMRQDLESVTAQLGEYKKAIELKDLALTKANENADIWMNASFKLQDRMSAIDDLKSKNQTLMFVAGVIFTSLAVWGAGHLAH
jgi:hypothetical protein